MNKLSKLVVLLCTAAPLMVFSATPDAAKTNAPAKPKSGMDALFGGSVVAKGKGVEVTRTELDAEVVKNKAVYAARQMPVPPDLEQEALRSLVIKQLILNQATPEERTKGKPDFDT